MSPTRSWNTGKGHQINIHHVHIADGFTDDCEELIHRWLRTNTLTYETFCEIWKDMQFSFLYHGRTSGAEMAELSEELLQIAKHYMVSNTDNFEESVAGLFLVYALVRLQPYPRFAALRLVPEDVPALTRIETVARRERRYDVLYILGSILIEGPVHYHAANRERGMETAIRKYLEGTTGIDRLGVRPKGVFHRQNEESDLLRELNSITKRYVDAKKAIGGESSLGLTYTDQGLATDLDRSLKEIINGIIDDTPESNKKMEDHYSRVQEIKDKAMRQAVDGVNYLASVANRASGSKGKNKKKGKGKGSNMDCLRPNAKRKRKASTSSSSSESEDLVIDSDESLTESEDESSSDDISHEPTKDINLEEFDQANSKEEEKEVNIKIDSLPVFIRTEQDGQLYEIEVIDNLDQPKTTQPDENTETRLKKLTEVTLEKLESGEGPSEVKKEKIGRRDKQDDVQRIKLRDKRELKKTALMSKFKRMGMLRMANFSDIKGEPPKDTKSNKTE